MAKILSKDKILQKVGEILNRSEKEDAPKA